MSTALILAAGLGQRLADVHDGPKWLTPVESTSPMREQLAAISASEEVDRLVVVTNRTDGPIAAQLAELAPTVRSTLVVNPDSARWNNWSSALLGLEHAGADEDVLLFNSDLFADRAWFATAIERIAASNTAALLVDQERPLTDEAMKVAGDGSVTRIGKVGVADPTGEYVGMAWWPAGTAGPLTRALAAYRNDPACANRWYEHGIDADIDAGTRYQIVPTPTSSWVEIDDPADLAAAVALRDR